MSPRIGRNLGRFQHSVALRMENIQPRRYMKVRWVYPPFDKSMKAVGMEEVET